MANIYLFKYNNYYNKLLKVQQTIEGYGDPLAIVMSSNFNPNDGIQARHVVNADFETIPDYCVVMTDYGEIESRWFVMSCKRIRKGQWHVELLRDSLAEYRSQVLEAVCFIEKGYVNNANPLVFNNENMGFNQIKSGEYLLKNELESPWLVLYLARYNNNGERNQFSGSLAAQANIKEDYNKSTLEEYEYYAFGKPSAARLGYSYIDRKNPQFIAEYRRANQQSKIDAMGLTNNSFTSALNNYGYPRSETRPKVPVIDSDKNLSLDEDMISQQWGILSGEFSSGVEVLNNLPNNTYLSQYLSDYNIQFGTQEGFDKLLKEDKKIIKVGARYYEIEVETKAQSLVSPVSPPVFLKQKDSIIFPIDADSSLGDQMKSVFFTDFGIQDIPNDAELNFKIQATVTNPFLYIVFHEITVTSIDYDIKYDAVYTKDAPYEIIAAPLMNVTFTIPKEGGGGEEFNHNGEIAKQVFQEIINKYHGAGNAYDLQIVPYCPINSADITLQNISFFTDSTQKAVACCIYLQTSTFTQTLTAPDIPIRSDYKISNELDLYRLVSPNGVGEYEFSPVKNGGNIEFYEVDCTLIPYNPYIKVNPIFSGLYGADYDDYRGLICGGDFSMPIVSSEWETYQLQNKYYQDIFNRQIAHQEYNNKFALAGDILGATTGAVSSGIEGLRLGGGAVGAAVGAGIGIIAGTADVVTNQMLRNEEIRYQKDQFGFQLGTIKARAQSLTRTTSFNQNNKYFPYIEYYSCTPVEEEALKKKMEYNGMTVGVIGKIADYLSPTYVYTYVQAELIEIDIPDDYQMVEEIARRLRGGIRIA